MQTKSPKSSKNTLWSVKCWNWSSRREKRKECTLHLKTRDNIVWSWLWSPSVYVALSVLHPSTVNSTYIWEILAWSLVAQTVNNLSAMQETQIRYLGQEDPLEKGMATHSSIFAWRITWTEEPGRLQSTVSQRVGRDWVTNTLPCSMYWPKCLGITQLNEAWTLPSMILQLRRIKAILKLF